jgi:hypothetical protein
MTGAGRRAAELIRRAIDLHGEDADPLELAMLHERLGMYLLPTGDREAGLAALERAAELVPDHPPSPSRVRVLASLGQAMVLSGRFPEARSASEEAIAVARAQGAPPPPQAIDILGNALCYLGRADEGLRMLAEACTREPDATAPRDLVRPYVYYSDALTVVGRLSDAARVAREGLSLARRLGIERGVGNVLAANAGARSTSPAGIWRRDRGPRRSRTPCTTTTACWPSWPCGRATRTRRPRRSTGAGPWPPGRVRRRGASGSAPSACARRATASNSRLPGGNGPSSTAPGAGPGP